MVNVKKKPLHSETALSSFNFYTSLSHKEHWLCIIGIKLPLAVGFYNLKTKTKCSFIKLCILKIQ